jgi:Regulator of chromosome condensation (RCC1) repeat
VRQIAGWYDGFWALKGEPGSATSRVLHWGRSRSGVDGRGADGAGNLGVIPNFRENTTPVEVLERRSVNGTLQAAPVDRVCSIAATSDRLMMIRALDNFGSPTDCNAGSAKTVWVAGTLTQYSTDAVGVAVPVPGLPAGVPARLIAQQATAQSSSGPMLVLMEDGRAFGWGTNIGNLFGLPLPASQSYLGNNVAPQALPGAWGMATDAAFSYVGLLVSRADGSVMVSGRNDGSELGLGPQTSGTVNNGPLPLLASAGVALGGVQALASSQAQVSLALRQGRILAWGAANQPMQGGSTARIDYPQLLPASGDGWRALSASNVHALAIAANGAVYTWGNGLRGALGNGLDSGSVLAPTLVVLP